MPLRPVSDSANASKYFLAKSMIFVLDDNYFKQMVVWLGSLTGYLLGHDNYDLLKVLLVFMVIDWITGIIAAHQTGVPLQSSKLPRSGIKLIIYFSLIAITHLFGQVFQLPNLEKLLIAYYIATEALSIAENADKLGLPLPAWLQQAIKGKTKDISLENNSNENKQ